MKCIITDHVVLSRVPGGPLAARIGPFARSQSAQGYARSSIHQQVLVASGLSHWLQQQGVALRHVNSDHISRYLRKGHELGTSVDIAPPKGLPADTVFCAAGACGAVRGLNEAPAQGGQNLPTTTGANYHFSTVQYVKNPMTKSVIPDQPGCKPGACGILKP